MLRGRIVELGGKPVEEIKAPPEAQWVLNGDRGLTYSAGRARTGSKVVAGEWWSPGYDGEPLVSFESENAEQLGLKIGDTVTVNVLGRNVTARIANLREVKWESLAINFVMVFSPNTLQAAPHNLLVTDHAAGADLARDGGAGDSRARPRLSGRDGDPRQGRADVRQRGVRQGDDGGAGGGQRHPDRRGPGAGAARSRPRSAAASSRRLS